MTNADITNSGLDEVIPRPRWQNFNVFYHSYNAYFSLQILYWCDMKIQDAFIKYTNLNTIQKIKKQWSEKLNWLFFVNGVDFDFITYDSLKQLTILLRIR